MGDSEEVGEDGKDAAPSAGPGSCESVLCACWAVDAAGGAKEGRANLKRSAREDASSQGSVGALTQGVEQKIRRCEVARERDQ